MRLERVGVTWRRDCRTLDHHHRSVHDLVNGAQQRRERALDEHDGGGSDTDHGPLGGRTHVVDGDTVHVSNGQTVRLIGMDTPELVDPRKVVQCFAREASNRAHQLLDGATVTLEYDPTQGRTDKYGRTLAYIRTANGALYNLRMIADGYAHEYTYRLPYRYQDQFRAAERDAHAHDRGLWSPTTCGGNTTAPVSSPPTTPQRSGCDPSYPTVCIPPPPPDLDCAQIPYRRFAVAGADPHRFDSDHNGIGCETG